MATRGGGESNGTGSGTWATGLETSRSRDHARWSDSIRSGIVVGCATEPVEAGGRDTVPDAHAPRSEAGLGPTRARCARNPGDVPRAVRRLFAEREVSVP
jgi:hypothetical protein